MFLHYIGKFNNSNLLQILKKMQTRKFDFLNTLSFSARILRKLLSKVWLLPFLGHGVYLLGLGDRWEFPSF